MTAERARRRQRRQADLAVVHPPQVIGDGPLRRLRAQQKGREEEGEEEEDSFQGWQGLLNELLIE